jgi:hypothetical protein
MRPILILPNGTVMVFHVRAVAELYRTIHGGTIVNTIPCQVNLERLTEGLEN